MKFICRFSLVYTIAFLVMPHTIFSQGWEKIYSQVEVSMVSGFLPSKDGGYVITGHAIVAGRSEDAFLMKIDAEGNREWYKTYGGIESDRITGFVESEDGYILVGATRSFGGTYDKVYLIRTDFSGTIIKDTVYHLGSTGDDRGWGIVKGKNNQYIIHASQPQSGLFYQANTIKIDNDLTILSDKHYGGSGVEYIYKFTKTLDGGYIGVGTTTSYGALGGGDIYVLKLDSLLTEQWYKTYSGANTDVAFGVYQTADSGYYIGARTDSYGAGGNDLYMLRTDKAGNVQWTKTYGTANHEYHGNLIKAKNGGLYFTATHNAASGTVAGDLWILKVEESNGDIIWDKKYGTRNDLGNYILETEDGGLIVAGTSANGSIQKYVYVVRTDESGNSLTNKISGNVYLDNNENCTIDAAETKLANVIIKIEPGPYYVTTDSLGFYSVMVGQGNFSVSQTLPNPMFSQLCPAGSHSVNFVSNNYQNSDNNNFADKGVACSFLKVDLSTPLLRRCFRNKYNVYYSNEGNVAASNVEITLEFPEAIIPLSSSILWDKNGNSYTFTIGSLAAGQSGIFTVTDSVSCLVSLGSTHCVKASIGPVADCSNPGDGSWDKSSVKVEGSCIGDTLVRFTITNTGELGNGNMDAPSEFRIYTDNALAHTSQFQLLGGETRTINIEANGQTIRLEADQRPGHPGRSRPRATVEACGEYELGGISLGFFNQVEEDDRDEFVEQDCQTVIGSFDPNDKAVKPEGLTNNHYIDESDVLEYKIRFQNTGTDTAFTVIIRDTLSGYLDVTTVKTLSASHPYTFRISGNGVGVAEWRFENILLVDSNKNEPASHGFIKYRIAQNVANAQGTVIENKAYIVFDYNEPVITNTAKNIVYDTVLSVTSPLEILSVNKSKHSSVNVKTDPNPFSDFTKLEVNGTDPSKEIIMEMYDLTGKEMQKTRMTDKQLYIYKKDLKPGIYIYKLLSENEIIYTGKLVIE